MFSLLNTSSMYVVIGLDDSQFLKIIQIDRNLNRRTCKGHKRKVILKLQHQSSTSTFAKFYKYYEFYNFIYTRLPEPVFSSVTNKIQNVTLCFLCHTQLKEAFFLSVTLLIMPTQSRNKIVFGTHSHLAARRFLPKVF